MGAAEVCDRLGIGRTRLAELMRRPNFPQPIKQLTAGYIWDGNQIEAWIAEHRPPPDEPETLAG
jgi:predicted DNA-binding transcriptional regulator AlpA